MTDKKTKGWKNAALGAMVSQLSDRGSKAFVDHRHRKPSR